MMKNFNIFGVHGKIRVLGGRRLGGVGLQKNNILWGIALKGGLGQFADLRGGTSQERGGGVFEGGRG